LRQEPQHRRQARGQGDQHRRQARGAAGRLAPLARAERPARVDSRWAADVWFVPTVVVEVLGAELTLSPDHTAGWGILREDAGLALRFPRFTGRWRDDKAPGDAATVTEAVELYRTARRTPAGT
jgi:DNA ligase-1